MSLPKQMNCLKTKGVYLGARVKDNRKVHVYMLEDIFAEVFYANDLENSVERINVISGLRDLNDYLENDFKTSF